MMNIRWWITPNPEFAFERGMNAAMLPPAIWVMGFFFHGPTFGIATMLWAAIYLGMTPVVAWVVARREPPGDALRAAALLAAGALPLALYIPLWRELTARPVQVAAFPVLFVWCGWALYMALRDNPPPLTPARRLFILRGGALIWGAVGLSGLAGAVLAILVLAFKPSDSLGIGLALGLFAAGGGLGLAGGWAALRMWAAATPVSAPSP